MPGVLVRDSLAPALHTGLTLNAAGSTNGTAVEVNKPGEVDIFVVYPATITGTTPTSLITIQGADDSGFSTNVVNVCQFPATSGTAASQQSLTKVERVGCWKRYMRAQLTLGGTTPVYTGLTITVRVENDRNSPITDTA